MHAQLIKECILSESYRQFLVLAQISSLTFAEVNAPVSLLYQYTIMQVYLIQLEA